MASGYGNNPYAQQEDNYNPYAGGQDAGYGGVPPGGYAHPTGAEYEMGNMSQQQPYQDNLQDFFSEVEEINGGIATVNANIARIEALHQRSLTDIDESNTQQTQHQLEAISAETSALNNNLASRIKTLKGKHGRSVDKGPQVGTLDRKFKETLRKYQMVEKTFADRTREQMARQFRIVKPDATEEEVQAACEDSAGSQIFSQALLKGNRRGEARSALAEVQARHNEIQRIEKTVIELAQLFNEMEQLVTEQEEMVVNIDQRGEEIVTNVDKAQGELTEAVGKARSARRKKWWCLLIVIIILIVIAAIIAAVVVTQQK